MIVNFNLLEKAELTQHTQVIIDNIICSSHEFHLTGTHFFENATETSDVDLFIQDDQSAYDFLKEMEFKEKDPSRAVSFLGSLSGTWSQDFVEKYMLDEKYNRRKHLDPLIQRGLTMSGIDVMFIKPRYFKLRKFIQELMKNTGVVENENKLERTKVWVYTYSLIRELEEYIG